MGFWEPLDPFLIPAFLPSLEKKSKKMWKGDCVFEYIVGDLSVDQAGQRSVYTD